MLAANWIVGVLFGLYLLVLGGILAPVLMPSWGARTETVQVINVLPPYTFEADHHPYGVRASDGLVYSSTFDHHLRAGDQLTVARDSRGRLLAVGYPGHAPQLPADHPWVLGLLVALYVLVLAGVGVNIARLRRHLRAVKADLGATPVETTVTLEPDIVRGAATFGAIAGAFVGYPLRARTASGQVVQIGIPARRLSSFRRFIEQAGWRSEFRVACLPSSRAMVRATAVGSAAVYQPPS
jgi:hypothetical protein